MRIAENIDCYLEHSNSYDTINITVDGSPESDLSFAGITENVQQIIDLDKKVCLEIYLNLSDDAFCFYNELQFSIRRRALEVLLDKISFIPEEKIESIILYRGFIDFTSYIKRNARASDEYTTWKTNLDLPFFDEEHLLHLFSANLLSMFFHSMSSTLPDHIKGALLFSLPYSLENAKVAELISEETFSHLEVGIKDPKYFLEGICWGKGSATHHLSYTGNSPVYSESDVKTGVILPFLGTCDYKKFEEICKMLQSLSIPYKIIEENLLNEKWFDIDHILFDHNALTFDGKRMVDGFIAAGGKGYTFDKEGSLYRENVTLEYGFLPLDNFTTTLQTNS